MRQFSTRSRRIALSGLCVAVLFPHPRVGAQVPPTPATPTIAAPKPVPAPGPLPLADIVGQADVLARRLQTLNAEASDNAVASNVAARLPELARETAARNAEATNILDSHPSLDTLRNLNVEWKNLGVDLPEWALALTARANQLALELAELARSGGIWEATLRQAQAPAVDSTQPSGAKPPGTPAEILTRIQNSIAGIAATQNLLEKRRAEVLTLQNRVAEEEARIAGVRASIERVRQETVDSLFVKDSPPIWSPQVRSRMGENLMRDSRQSFLTQVGSVGAYVAQHVPKFIAQAILLVFFVMGLMRARRRVDKWLAAEPTLLPVAQVFDLPVATGIVLTILISGWIHPQAPRLLSAILGAAALLPTVIILRKVVQQDLYPLLNALVIFYFVDLLKEIAVALPLLVRFLSMLEMLGAVAFVFWLLRSKRLNNLAGGAHVDKTNALRFGLRFCLAVFGAALAAEAFGYVSLASLMGKAVLGSAYLAVILYVGVKILDGLVMFTARVRPVSLLKMVSSHRLLIRRRVHRVLVWLATLFWVWETLDLLSLQTPVVDRLKAVLTADVGIGRVHFTLAAIAAFLITIWAAFLLSRFIRFLLAEDVYTRFSLSRGIPYAVSTMLHYFILLAGFLFAIASLGIDMSRFTILAGAFGVGLGFGLQNIVSNFVSGIILLFERPVKIGDIIQLGTNSGSLRHIGLRASVMRTVQGSEIIVPNATLISGEVTNWTLSDRQRMMQINVGVAYGTDPELVISLLTGVALKHGQVMKDPPPHALFLAFGDSSLDFQLLAWTEAFDKWMRVKSELTVGINRALNDAGISIPFPQRDIHIQTAVPDTKAPASNKQFISDGEPAA